ARAGDGVLDAQRSADARGVRPIVDESQGQAVPAAHAGVRLPDGSSATPRRRRLEGGAHGQGEVRSRDAGESRPSLRTSGVCCVAPIGAARRNTPWTAGGSTFALRATVDILRLQLRSLDRRSHTGEKLSVACHPKLTRRARVHPSRFALRWTSFACHCAHAIGEATPVKN